MHLRVNESRQRVLMELENLPRLVFGEVGAEVPNGLPCKVIEQLGLLVVRHIVKVHEPPDDVVFQPALLRSALANS